MIILENLIKQGYRRGDKRVGQDAAHTFLVVKELARLHASSLLLQDRDPTTDTADKFDTLDVEWSDYMNLGIDFGEYIERCLDIGGDLFEEIGGYDVVDNWINRLKKQAWQMYKQQLVREKPFVAILHGDSWINNLIFRLAYFNERVEVCRETNLE